jgi:acyl dehydratase
MVASAVDLKSMSTRYFEDFKVGQRFTSGTRLVSETDLTQFAELTGDKNRIHLDAEHARTTRFGQRVVHGAYGISIFFGLLHEAGLVRESAIAVTDLDWRFTAPIFIGDRLHFEMLITRCRPSSAEHVGCIHPAVRMLNDTGTVVQQGRTTMLVAARSQAVVTPETDVGSLSWARCLADVLATDPSFAAGTAGFDGAIGICSGAEESQFRIYKGEILEVGSRTPLGADFTIYGEEAAWVELLLSSRNDYIARAMSGEFSVRGDMYTYLRLTKAVQAICDAGRELTRRSPNFVGRDGP